MRNPVLLAGLSLALTTSAAVAAPTLYTSRSGFEAALAALRATETTQTFDGVDAGPAGNTTTITPNRDATGRFSATIGGVTLDSPRAINAQRDLVGNTVTLNTAFSSVPANALSTGYLGFSFAAPSIAFGIDLPAFTVPFSASAFGASYAVTGPGFFGVIDPAASATRILFTRTTNSNDPVTFDNVSLATLGTAPVATPEPATAALLAAGLLALARRRSPSR